MRKKLYIEGMSCQHCVGHVANALKEVKGVEYVEVDLKGSYAIMELSKDIDRSIFSQALDEAGYHLGKLEDL